MKLDLYFGGTYVSEQKTEENQNESKMYYDVIPAEGEKWQEIVKRVNRYDELINISTKLYAAITLLRSDSGWNKIRNKELIGDIMTQANFILQSHLD